METLEEQLKALYQKRRDVTLPIDKQIKTVEAKLEPTNKFIGGYFEA